MRPSSRAFPETAVLVFLLLGSVLSLGAAGGTDPAGAQIRVLSFNILGGDGTGGSTDGRSGSGQNAWASRRDLVIELFQKWAPDVIGLQKAGRHSLDDLIRAMPGFGEVGVGRDDGETAGEYAAVLYRTDRFELADSGTFWLSETPETPGSSGWGARGPRICTWARLVDRNTGTSLLVFNTHLDPGSVNSRERGAALILERIRSLRGADAVILTGDMNSAEGSEPILRVTADGDDGPALGDSFRRIHPDSTEVGTRHQFTGRTSGDKVDYIFVSSAVAVQSAEIIRDSFDGRYPSDHYPVTAVIRITSAAESEPPVP